MYHHRLAARRFKTLLAWASAAGLGLALLGATGVRAQDRPAEFATFERASTPLLRAGVTPEQWERVNRPADHMGPRLLRPVDQQLLQAAHAARWAAVLELVSKQGADPDATDLRGTSVLVQAARAGEGGLVRELLRHGALVDRRNHDGHTALGVAAFQGHAHLVVQLLKAGADAAKTSATGQTALHLAALAGHSAVVARLLGQGVPVDLLNSRRETALDVAAQTGQLVMLDQLLVAGADTARAGNR